MSDLYPVFFAAGIVLLTFTGRRVRKAAQPIRLEFATKAEDLLNSDQLPFAARRHVHLLLNHAFDMRGPIVFGYFAVPFIVVAMIFRQRWLSAPIVLESITDHALRTRFYEVIRLHDRITLANNPIMMMILNIEIMLLVPVAILIRSFIFGTMPKFGDRDTVMTEVEDRSSRVAQRLRFAGQQC